MTRRLSPVFWLILLGIALVALFPYIWIVLTSFKARTDILATPPVWIHAPNWINYRNMLIGRGFDGYLLNSIEIGLSSTMLALIVGTLAAYAFARYRVPAGNHLFFYILATRLGPPIAYALPMYFLCAKLGLLKSHIGVIVAHATFNLVLVVWMMKTFFDEIPMEVEEAAKLDGCSEWQLFSRISVPMALPGLVTAAIFVFIFSWNELLYAMILSAGKANTLPAMIPSLILNTGTLWGEVAAAAVVQTVPVIIFTFIAQRHLIRGLTFGAVKGCRITAVDDVSLRIPDGAFVILVGPSGCGKTSLLRLLAGLEDATSGRIFIGEKDVTQVHPRERDIAMVFQSYALYPHMSVRRNMRFALELRNVDEREIERRVAAAADILGIPHLLDRQPKQLSGGQRQRVALGRAIVREPSVFLFDEPLSNLDAKLRTAMRGELIRLHKRLGTTVVCVTHDQVEAMTMGQIVVVMKDGAVQQCGAPLDIYREPQNLFVAEFIGSPAMNFLTGRLDAAGAQIVTDGGTLPLMFHEPQFAVAGTAPRTEIVIGIRPEHLAIGSPAKDAAGAVHIEGVVEVVEPLGAETIVEFNCQGARILARVAGDNLPTAGQRLRLSAELRHIYHMVGRSLIGGRFDCAIEAAVDVGGHGAIIPTVAGQAWLTGVHQHMLDPSDPWPEGYKLADTWPNTSMDP